MTGDTGRDDDTDKAPPADPPSDREASSPDADDPTPPPDGSPGPGDAGVDPERVAELRDELDAVRSELAALESRVDDKTVHRDDVEAELRRYVRARQRRGYATGWGPYLVLLYGTAMTLGAFYYLGDLFAVLAMLVIWLSTLGLSVFMVVASTGLTAGRKAAGLRDLVGRIRS
jgi:hypothetical protein